MHERAVPRFEPVPLRLLSWWARFDAVIWPTVAGMTLTNSTDATIPQRTVNVRTTNDGRAFTLLNGAPLMDPDDGLLEAARRC